MVNRIKKFFITIMCAISVLLPATSSMMPTVMADEAAGDVLLEKSNTCKYSSTDATLYMWDAISAGGKYGWTTVKTENAHIHIFYNTTDGYLWLVSALPDIALSGSATGNVTLTEITTVNGVDFYYHRINKTAEKNITLDPSTLDPKIPSVASLEEALAIGDISFVDVDGGDVVVSASVEAGYTVKLPAVMQLTYNPSTRRFEYNYTVSVKGIVDDSKALAVVPNSSITLFNAARDESLTATVTQTKSYWVNEVSNESTQTLIDYGTFSDATGVCYLNKVKSGNWAGLLHFTFSIVDK